MSFRGKILVIRGGAIGDFILTLPALAALRRQFPQAKLEVLGYPHIIHLAVAGGLVDDVRSIDARPLAGFFARNGTLAEELRDYFSEFDLIVSYLYDPDQIFKTNIGRCSPAQFIAGPHRPDDTANVPAAKVFLQPLERLAIFEADPVPQLVLRGLDAPASATSQLVLHPGSGSEQKNWPELQWAELLRRLVDFTGFNLLLVGGEAEGARLQRLAAQLPPTRVRVAQHLPLTELAGVLARSHGFVGHDSGISHLAAAVGLPGVVLWGHTSETVWRPPSERVVILKHPSGLERLSVAEVLAQVQAICAPV